MRTRSEERGEARRGGGESVCRRGMDGAERGVCLEGDAVERFFQSDGLRTGQHAFEARWRACRWMKRVHLLRLAVQSEKHSAQCTTCACVSGRHGSKGTMEMRPGSRCNWRSLRPAAIGRAGPWPFDLLLESLSLSNLVPLREDCSCSLRPLSCAATWNSRASTSAHHSFRSRAHWPPGQRGFKLASCEVWVPRAKVSGQLR